jgi:RNA polymerase sigma-70 factor (ECF subfamily)
MRDKVAWLPATLVETTPDFELNREFEARLTDSSALAIRVAFSVLRNQADAEDVAQEAFAKAHRVFAQLRDRDSFRAWLVRMTWRMALDHVRSGRRRMIRDRAAVPAECGATVEDTAIDEQQRAHLWRAVDQLPERLRLVIVLSVIEGHSVKDVAALTGIAEGTVKSRLFDARARLKEALR